MSDKGSVPDTASARIITKVVLTYRLDGDPKDAERTLVLEHGSGGEIVDGIVWGEELMRKLAYLEGEKCIEPKKEPGRGDWKVFEAKGEARSRESYDSQAATLSATASLSEAEVAAGAETRASASGDGDCIWVHQITCEWEKYCPRPVL